MRRIGLHLGGVRSLELTYVARVLDHRHVHAEANTEKRNALLASVAHRVDLTLNAAVSEATRHQHRIQMRQQADSLHLDFFCVDVIDLNPGIGLQAGMIQRFVQRLVGINQIHVLAHHTDAHQTLSLTEFAAHHVLPLRQIGRGLRNAEALQNEVVEATLFQMARNLIDGVCIHQRNHRPLLYVGEQRNFAPRALVDLDGTATEQHLWLQTDRAQLLNRVLGRLGLDLARRRNEGNQCEMH